MQDECQECEHDFKKHKISHLDLWMESQLSDPAADVIACENALTPDNKLPVLVHPPAHLPVDKTPLFDFANGRATCFDNPNPPLCIDQGQWRGRVVGVAARVFISSTQATFAATRARFRTRRHARSSRRSFSCRSLASLRSTRTSTAIEPLALSRLFARVDRVVIDRVDAKCARASARQSAQTRKQTEKNANK